MNRIFDMHNHILWGVDDGSQDIEMTLRMLRMAEQDGITDIILTPHNKPNRRNLYATEMVDMIAELKKKIAVEGIRMNLYPGNEIFYRLDVCERLEIGKAATMAGSRYVLLEFNPMDDWEHIKRGADDLLQGGYFPIIAHVERYVNVIKDIDRVDYLVDKGCYIQINAASIMGEIGFIVKKQCKNLMKEGLVSFIATDAHEDVRRVPKLAECVRYITKKYGEETAFKLFETNPQMILDDKIIR
ncbi:MAG: hypothetical protein J5525_05810 [Lachnospiraceae bacterium]|nr:hypothetical protein [Lachnospiraceae bacterium]